MEGRFKKPTIDVRLDFLNIMAHELKTPLNSIVGFSEILQNEGLTCEQNEMLSILKRSSLKMNQTIDSILEYLSTSFEKTELDAKPFYCKQIISEVLELYQLEIKHKNVDIYISENKPIPLLVGDSSKVSKILSSLISNAVKFTNQGSISINVDYETNESGLCSLDINIKDTGVGIPQSLLSEVIKPFRVVDFSAARNYEGLGLGLSIANNLVKILQGTLSIKSDDNEGTEVSLILSFPFTDDLNLENVTLPSKALSNKKLTILIVEDNVTNQILIKKILQREGHIVQTASDGIEALELAEGNSFDLIFMDFQMPRLDGIKTAIELRKNNSFKYTPIVAMSANNHEELKQRCFSAGMNGFVLKPFKLEQIYNILNNYHSI